MNLLLLQLQNIVILLRILWITISTLSRAVSIEILEHVDSHASIFGRLRMVETLVNGMAYVKKKQILKS